MSQTHQELGRDVGAAVVKVFPPALVWSLTLNDWLAIVSIVYVLMQGAYLAWKWRREWKKRAAGS